MIIGQKYSLRAPLDWNDLCEREIKLQRVFWNTLVRIERKYRNDIEELLRSDQKYNDICIDIETCSKEIDGLVSKRKAERKAARSLVATPELDTKITEKIEHRKNLWKIQKPIRRDLFKQFKETLDEMATKRFEDFKIARQQSGLWWCNYNAVLLSFDATLRRLKPGQNVQYADENNDDVGRLTIQVNKFGDIPSFMKGDFPNIMILDGPDPDRPEYKLFLAAIMSKSQMRLVTWPIYFNRPFPENATVKMATISRSRERPGRGLRSWRWYVTFAIDVPEPAEPPGSQCIGVDIGWRKMAEGIRIATIADDDGGMEHVMLPNKWCQSRIWVSEIFGKLRVDARKLLLPRRFDAVNRENIRELADALSAVPKYQRGYMGHNWLNEYKNARGYQLRLDRQRRDLYRVAAKKIVMRSQKIGIDKTSLEKIAKMRNTPIETRRMRTWSSPHELVGYIANAARREGSYCVEVKGPTTLTCNYCGHKNTATDAQRVDLVWNCENCHRTWDQDENAARNCLDTMLHGSEKIETEKRHKPVRLTRKRAKVKEAELAES